MCRPLLKTLYYRYQPEARAPIDAGYVVSGNGSGTGYRYLFSEVSLKPMIYQQVTLSGDAEWPKVADAVIEALQNVSRPLNSG